MPSILGTAKFDKVHSGNCTCWRIQILQLLASVQSSLPVIAIEISPIPCLALRSDAKDENGVYCGCVVVERHVALSTPPNDQLS